MRFQRRFMFVIWLIVLFTTISCNQQRIRDEMIVKKWLGKKILFPTSSQVAWNGIDAIPNEIIHKEYKILVYVDSIGCTSCRLGLNNWYQRIQEMEQLVPGKVGFLFFMQPKENRQKDLEFMLRRDGFKYPVFIDLKDEINQLNSFESNPKYQCFLLDKENKVIAIGNPQENYYIWEFYKKIVTKNKVQNVIKKTFVEVERQKQKINKMKQDKTSEVVFVLKNTGAEPLIVYHIEAACGCTVPQWTKKPVPPNEVLEITVFVTPESQGFFSKNLDIYTNSDLGVIKCNIYGEVH